MPDSQDVMMMDQLEQRNMELSSLLKSSEKSRKDLELMLQEQNEQLTTLRANTLIMHTLEEEMNHMTKSKGELFDKLSVLEAEAATFKKQEYILRQKLEEVESENGRISDNYRNEYLEQKTKLNLAQNLFKEKERALIESERFSKELFEKCNMLGKRNKDTEKELSACMQSEAHLKEIAQQMHQYKNQLEKDIDELVAQIKTEKSAIKDLKTDLEARDDEMKNTLKQLSNLEDENKANIDKISSLTTELREAFKKIKSYESGEIISAEAQVEMQRWKNTYESREKTYQSEISELKALLEQKNGKIKQAELIEKKFEVRHNDLESKQKYCRENHMDKKDVQLLRNELELKSKLEMNNRLQKVSETFELEQEDLVKTMRLSLSQRREYDMDVPYSRPCSRLQNL